MKISDLGALYAPHMESLNALAQGGPWRFEARALQKDMTREITDASFFLSVLQKLQRAHKVHAAGLGGNVKLRLDYLTFMMTDHIKPWYELEAAPVEAALLGKLAEKIYNMRPGHGDVGRVALSAGARGVAEALVEKCFADKAPCIFDFVDPIFDALVLNYADEAGVQALGDAYMRDHATVTREMIVRSGMSDAELPVTADPAKRRLYEKAIAPFFDKDIFYTLTSIPSRRDAEVDGIPYMDYLKLFFEMCDQPWDEISKAQKSLINEFNTASRVRITNEDGTDVSMSLVDEDGSHFTFVNSLIAKNVPGSEIFSAPRRDSVEGTVVAKGRFVRSGKLMENLRLVFNKGRLVEFSAEQGQDVLENILSVDEGAKGVGELGIGTNPHLTRHVSNGLLVEKIGGSFHLALGRAYSYTDYLGEPVKVDNGNKSGLHWDVTTMLRGKAGRIYLDDRLVMDDGKWIDAQYDVLNRGWDAVPEEKKPAYWQQKSALSR